MTAHLQRMKFRDISCLNNATTKVKGKILALSMYHKLRRYGPLDRHVQTYEDYIAKSQKKNYQQQTLY